MILIQWQPRYGHLCVAAIAVVGLDVASKLAAATANGQRRGPIVPVHNPKFSLGVSGAPFALEVVCMLAGIVAASLYLLPRLRDGRISGWIAGLLLGGALSNLLDRALTGAVHDFVATPWVVFNVADIAVLAGTVAVAASALRVREGR
jgi:lipoprotein signal peptidase